MKHIGPGNLIVKCGVLWHGSRKIEIYCTTAEMSRRHIYNGNEYVIVLLSSNDLSASSHCCDRHLVMT